MKCTLIDYNENMSLCLVCLSSSLRSTKKIERQPNKIKNKKPRDRRDDNSTAAIIITITRVRHRMWAKRKSCMRRLYCSLSASFRFRSEPHSSRARLSFHFFSFCLCQPFSLYFVLTLCDSIRFYWFSALGSWNCT